MKQDLEFDVVIIGSGAGGGTMALALAKAGLKIALVERGGTLPQEQDNWRNAGVFGRKYQTQKKIKFNGSLEQRGFHYYVGGETKFYGAALYRLREKDFELTEYPTTVSPAWPLRYKDLEPFYSEAERLYRVHGSDAQDPTAPPRHSDYPFAPIPSDPFVQPTMARLRKAGYPVCAIPLGLDYGAGGHCVLCGTCDGYACRAHAKMDAEVACVRPALATGNVTLFSESRCERLVTNTAGTAIQMASMVRQDGTTFTLSAPQFILSCGWVGSPALLLRSTSSTHSRGLANSSGLVGRGIAGHLASPFFLLHPFRKVPQIQQKTFAINQFAQAGPWAPYPLGVIQGSGRLPMWLKVPAWKAPVVKAVVEHSLLGFIMSELTPDPTNSVRIDDQGMICIDFKPVNTEVFRQFHKLATQVLRKAGAPFLHCPSEPVPFPWHPVGTVRFGNDPKTSVLNAHCRTHDVENLYVVDASFMPSGGTLNSTLTIIAQSLRVAKHLAAARSGRDERSA